MPNRDEFRRLDADILAKRVGGRCSNPGCRQSTTGPRDDPSKAVNIGVSAHITAAASGGPRYDASLSPDERRSIENGIWLCQNCARLIDSDTHRYSVTLLRQWKSWAEQNARSELEGTPADGGAQTSADLVLEHRNEKILSERHDYRLEVSVHNVGTSVLRDYHVDVEIPTAILVDITDRIQGRSDNKNSLFRMTWRAGADDIFPGDRKLVMNIAYFMDQKLFTRDYLFSRPVRATLYQGGYLRLVVEREFREMQCF